MNRHCLGILILFLPFAAHADDQPDPKSSLLDQLAALQKAHKDAEAAYFKAAEGLPDTPEGQKKYNEIWKTYDKCQSERFLAAVELAKTGLKSDAGLAALEWVLTIPRSYYSPAGKPAMELVTEHYAAHPKVAKLVAILGWVPPDVRGNPQEHAAALGLFRAVVERNSDRTARGQAAMALASQAKSRFALAEYGRTQDVNQLAAEAEQAFEAVLMNYADCPRLTRDNAGTLGEMAKSELFELRHLRVGKPAAEIEGEDLDGQRFRLSDYRGKVVVLDFWGDW